MADAAASAIDDVTLARLQEIARGRLLIFQHEACSALGISKSTLLDEIDAGGRL